MKIIGWHGRMSGESSIAYYRIIKETVQAAAVEHTLQ